jgi:hypothetical protein
LQIASAGLKRYFYGKRVEGLLSAHGLQHQLLVRPQLRPANTYCTAVFPAFYSCGKAYGGAAVELPAPTLSRSLTCPACASAGLKRYFYGKRMEGLLSARGLRILDAACEVGLEDPSKPVRLWGSMSRWV